MKTDKRTLDRIDRALVGALTKNARLSNKELAAMVDLAPSSCLERVRRLVREGTIRGFVADVDPSALGYSIEAMMAVRLRQHSREHYDAFREHALTLPEVVAVYHMAGENDFLVHVLARDAQHLRDLAIDRFITRAEVGHIETWLVFEHLRGRGATFDEG
ncbi:MAG: Lrp/AsnC family transcriptional regulator [Gemmatimonadetes bacterium]|jgi:DNA-binding Lrp family transcriptional regulator|nr:Lrp/AsnC family transcriptional regulator [Gemmatimonadota bacterium]